MVGGGGGVAAGARAGPRPGPAGRMRGTDSGLAAFRCIGKFPSKLGSICAGYFRASKPKVRYDGTTAATVRTKPPRSSLERRNQNSPRLEFKMGRTANSHPTLRREHLSSGVISWKRSMSILQGSRLAGIPDPDAIRRTWRMPQSGIASDAISCMTVADEVGTRSRERNPT